MYCDCDCDWCISGDWMVVPSSQGVSRQAKPSWGAYSKRDRAAPRFASSTHREMLNYHSATCLTNRLGAVNLNFKREEVVGVGVGVYGNPTIVCTSTASAGEPPCLDQIVEENPGTMCIGQLPVWLERGAMDKTCLR